MKRAIRLIYVFFFILSFLLIVRVLQKNKEHDFHFENTILKHDTEKTIFNQYIQSHSLLNFNYMFPQNKLNE